MARYGYLLVDEHDSDISRQAMQLDTIGSFKRIFVDRHIRTTRRREQRRRLLQIISTGDVLYAASADRFASNLADFVNCYQLIEAAGADIVLLEEQLDSRSQNGKLSIRALKSFANLNFNDQSAKKKAGIKRARASGRRIGRPPVSIPPGFRAICRDWQDHKISTREAMALSGLKSTSFYKKAAELGFLPPGRHSGD